MLANLKNIKQAVLLNLDEDNQMHILAGVPNPFAYEQSNSDLESISNDSDRKMFKVRRNRSNSSRRLAKLVNLSGRSNSLNKVKSVSNDSDSESNNILEDIFDGFQMINLSDNSSHRHQIARVNHSEDTHSVDSLFNLSDDGFMQAYCRSLGYGTDNCRKWAGYSAKSGSTNIASAKSDSDNDNKSTSSFTDSDDSRDGDSSSNSALSEYLMQLNMFTKMGKGLKKFEKTAKKGRDIAKKAYPQAEKAWAIAAPKNHDKYAPQLAKGYKTFNTQANKMGGWNTIDKAAEQMQAMGLMQLSKELECKALEREAHQNPLFVSNSKAGIAYRFQLQYKIGELGC